MSSRSLRRGSPERLLIGAMAVQYYQALQYIDRAGKMGLLKFSEGDYLDNIGALRGIIREPAQRASCKGQGSRFPMPVPSRSVFRAVHD